MTDLHHASVVNDYDLTAIRADFPILTRRINGKPLVYLDNAASAQKPRHVIDAITNAYSDDYSNVHRGLHTMSAAATEAYEQAREKVRAFLNAQSDREVIFTKGGTEAINLVAASYGRSFVEGDEVIVSVLEHHSNIVPWQLLQERTGIRIKVAPVDQEGNFLLDAYQDLLSARTRLVSVAHVSNALGTVLPVRRIIDLAHEAGAKVLLDGCQAAVHLPIDVQALGADFYVLTGHKLYGPTGIGILWGREALLDRMPPYQGGGDMIRTVSFEGTEFADLPAKFEAGTPPIVQAIGLGAAIDYLTTIGFDRVGKHEADILDYATERLTALDGVNLFGTARERTGVLSFTMDDAHAHDIGTLVDQSGVAVRAGHHCAQPLMEHMDVVATARASFALYNSRAEVDVLVEALHRVRRLFGRA